MPNATALYLTTRGFTEHDREVLSRQLKVVTAKAGLFWSYADSEQDGRPMLVLDKAAGSERIEAVFIVGSNRLRLSSLDAPLRMFNLLELLQLCESRLPSHAPAAGSASLARRIASVRGVARLQFEPASAWVDAPTDTIWAPWESIEELVHQMRSHGQCLAIVSEPFLGETASLFRHSLKAAAWSLALHERDKELGHRNWSEPGLQFRIGAWPLLSEWQSSPAMLRLSALYSRQFASLEQGMDFSRANEAGVIAFLHACECCGMNLLTRAGPAVAAAKISEPGPTGLLQRLRASLGLSFRRS